MFVDLATLEVVGSTNLVDPRQDTSLSVPADREASVINDAGGG